MRKETSAGAVVFFQKGKKREYLLLNYLGGHWDFPKGHVQLHEKPIEAALREIKEETGLDVKIIRGFERKITYSFKHRNEFIIKDVIFYLVQAKSQKVILSEEHKGYVWLSYEKAFELITFNKEILRSAENFLNKKGFTLLEAVIVLSLIMIIFGITTQILKPSVFLKRTRDIQRISDLKKLDLALRTYIITTSSPNLGPTNTGVDVDEASSSIFISVPFDKEDLREQYIVYNKMYYFKQVSSTEIYKINGQGWLPVNFAPLPYPPLFSLPVDPINSFQSKLFYSYVFNRSSTTYEINANLEYEVFRYNGKNDQTSTDLGDNHNIYEVGTDKRLMPNNLYQ